jgi:hypothetical protein
MLVMPTATLINRPFFANADPFAAPVVLLPHRRTSSSGVYDEAAVDLFQAVEAAGVDACWSEPQESRSWQARRSLEQLGVDLLIGVGSNLAWATVVAAVGRWRGRHVSVTVGSRTTPEASERWINVEGDAEAVAAILESMNPWNDQH